MSSPLTMMNNGWNEEPDLDAELEMEAEMYAGPEPPTQWDAYHQQEATLTQTKAAEPSDSVPLASLLGDDGRKDADRRNGPNSENVEESQVFDSFPLEQLTGPRKRDFQDVLHLSDLDFSVSQPAKRPKMGCEKAQSDQVEDEYAEVIAKIRAQRSAGGKQEFFTSRLPGVRKEREAMIFRHVPQCPFVSVTAADGTRVYLRLRNDEPHELVEVKPQHRTNLLGTPFIVLQQQAEQEVIGVLSQTVVLGLSSQQYGAFVVEMVHVLQLSLPYHAGSVLF
ncbi:unnamed protein product [Darwinula stevensoni]|uniref:Uncharacterized protein n=1 Tax=Darwinula stevensoni TaxID=69355 RepID=A0A7R9FRX9_9CRUS|nr:unnamed protein product [Darwinula stevensoni]CAG0902307.1 unnamed protein product [Darwinula stevensoni]